MEISCSHCKKGFSISEDQIYDYKQGIILSCPKCSKEIEIDLEDLQEAVSVFGRDLPFGEELKQLIVDGVDSLPPMPQVAMKARRILSNPDSGFSELAEVIETDQGIATQVLKIANSAYYGAVSEVSTVQKAGVIMGTKTLLELLTLACSSSLLGDRLNGYELDAGDLWEHALSTASCARVIANICRPEIDEDAFSAGLIHDCGKLILDPYIVERKIAFSKILSGKKSSFLDAEKKVLGFDHAEIASDVCMKWHIPENIANAIRYHHNPSESPEKDLTYIVHLADAIALMSGIGIGFDGMLYKVDESALEILGLSADDINSIMCEAVKYVEGVTDGD